jgi:hypothetical protein
VECNGLMMMINFRSIDETLFVLVVVSLYKPILVCMWYVSCEITIKQTRLGNTEQECCEESGKLMEY